MDKADYARLLSAASVDDSSKFLRVDDKRPKSLGRPPKHFHPLLKKGKDGTPSYVKYYLRTTPIHSHPRVPD